MTWTKLGDTWSERLDLLKVTRDARLLHVEALIWCNRHLTNGVLPVVMVRRITDASSPIELSQQLVDAGVWEVLEEDRWQIDWSEQVPADEIDRRRSEAADRKRRSRQHQAGDHSECLPKYCKSVTRDLTRDERPPDPTRPDPTRPGPKEPGRGRWGPTPTEEREPTPGLRCVHGRPVAVDGGGCEHCAGEPLRESS